MMVTGDVDPNVNVNDDSVFQYDVNNGSCATYCCFSLASYCLFLPCYCVARKMISSQQARIVNNKLNYRFDCWFYRTDQMVPLDRIQDVGITENCCQRLWGVSSLSVQTAGGGEKPEIVINAVKNPHRVRDYILHRRDEVANSTSANAAASDGTGGFVSSPLPVHATGGQEAKAMNETLSRIEKLIELGLKQHGASVQTKDKIDHNDDSESSNLLH